MVRKSLNGSTARIAYNGYKHVKIMDWNYDMENLNNKDKASENAEKELRISDVISSKIDKPKIRLSIISTKHEQWENNFSREGYCFSKYIVGESFRLINEDKEIVFSSTQLLKLLMGTHLKP